MLKNSDPQRAAERSEPQGATEPGRRATGLPWLAQRGRERLKELCNEYLAIHALKESSQEHSTGFSRQALRVVESKRRLKVYGCLKQLKYDKRIENHCF